MLWAKAVERVIAHILVPIKFFRNSCRVCDNVEKYGKAREATDNNTIGRIRLSYWIRSL
jgi:hypothetical protein